MAVQDTEFARIRNIVLDLKKNGGGIPGPPGPIAPTQIAITWNQETNENIYIAVGSLYFDPTQYPGKSFRLIANGFTNTPNDVLYVKLIDTAANSTLAELFTNSQMTSTLTSAALTLQNSPRQYEIHIKNGGTTINTVKLLSATFDIY